MKPSGSASEEVSRAERRVVSAAMRLADKGRGFVFRDDGRISDMKQAQILERACDALRSARKK